MSHFLTFLQILGQNFEKKILRGVKHDGVRISHLQYFIFKRIYNILFFMPFEKIFYYSKNCQFVHLIGKNILNFKKLDLL